MPKARQDRTVDRRKCFPLSAFGCRVGPSGAAVGIAHVAENAGLTLGHDWPARIPGALFQPQSSSGVCQVPGSCSGSACVTVTASGTHGDTVRGTRTRQSGSCFLEAPVFPCSFRRVPLPRHLSQGLWVWNPAPLLMVSFQVAI